MKKFKYNIIRIFDLYIAPLTVNGYKEELYFNKMKEKYTNDGSKKN